MLGVIHSAASDFSAFCYPRSLFSPVICNEVHETSIEERYCPKQHIHECDDREWEELLAEGLQLFDESEADVFPPSDQLFSDIHDETEDLKTLKTHEDEEMQKSTPDAPPPTPESTLSTPSLIGGNGREDSISSIGDESEPDSDYDGEGSAKKAMIVAKLSVSRNKRKRGKGSKPFSPRKRLCRTDSTNSDSTISSIASVSSNTSSATALLLQSMMKSENPWKCPHCPWIQHTQRLPDFLRHQRSHFVSQSDWPCPNPKCGKGFARKDSLKRHLDNKATGCKRPPGYTVC
ncbi:uncharacterized protein FOMMEDRAFT_149786 [Fomitiporia mediterranea MF3/22]|uniref:uncharacterized protein n=1 Tax=Fomitiporia mediterranea (strain MF3/22) TaxID=694068 RepID=UPI0004408AE6|nr:uncharacterized protein FOMMEDRAFT_149786 [Fomitiporia mediterranea MF3/22]EJD07273.1 hypothetical protein FOMMEDRAFT_149786 [Fomitiporia mediterranea MF3/22]